MKLVGITGGVGAGKTSVLSYIEKNCNCRIIRADELANDLKKKGQICYEPLVKLLGRDVLGTDGEIDKKRMAEQIFKEQALLEKINAIIHPAVKETLLKEIEVEREKNEIPFFFIEAALLIEDGYAKIVDELWYIYASEETRRERLKETRGYSDEKITAIMQSQLGDKEFRKYCKEIIENDGDFEKTKKSIDVLLRK